jgi:signal transduction histidine kinase
MTETDNRLAREIRTLAEASPGHLAEISHELRTPLTIIAGYVEMLQDDSAEGLTPTQQTMLATVASTSPDVPAADQQKSAFTELSRATQVSLALCRAIAANHGGELELVSSTITVWLPLAASKLRVGEDSETGRGW